VSNSSSDLNDPRIDQGIALINEEVDRYVDAIRRSLAALGYERTIANFTALLAKEPQNMAAAIAVVAIVRHVQNDDKYQTILSELRQLRTLIETLRESAEVGR